MWIASADYKDGTRVDRPFCDTPDKSDSEREYELEEWLIEHHEGCTWYSVSWVPDEEYETWYR